MKHIVTFESFNPIKETMIFEEWKLPTYQDTIKRKISFLNKIDLSEFEPPATHQSEIKELWRKIMKKMYTKEKAGKYIELVDNSDVLHLTNTFKIIKKIKASLTNKEDIGHILYHDELEKFFYEKPVNM